MKNNRLTATVSAILSLCFPLCACADEPYIFVDPIEYTAENPVVPYEGTGYENSVAGSFVEFKNYYVENYSGSKLFLFDSNCGYTRYWGYYPPYYEIAEKNDKIFVYEEFEYADSELGVPPYKKKISGEVGGGEHHNSFVGEIAIQSLSNKPESEVFTFEFGQYDRSVTYSNGKQAIYRYKFANIFSDEEGVATFYYIPYVPITQEWFENFLTENLVWGDSLEYEETENFGGEE